MGLRAQEVFEKHDAKIEIGLSAAIDLLGYLEDDATLERHNATKCAHDCGVVALINGIEATGRYKVVNK